MAIWFLGTYFFIFDVKAFFPHDCIKYTCITSYACKEFKLALRFLYVDMSNCIMHIRIYILVLSILRNISGILYIDIHDSEWISRTHTYVEGVFLYIICSVRQLFHLISAGEINLFTDKHTTYQHFPEV